MRKLTIRWQRLIDEKGETCPRCHETGEAVETIFNRLQKALSDLGFEVELAMDSLDSSTFEETPLESNRIWISGKSLEEWIGATVGKSQCCDACGDNQCRTISADGDTYESIPGDLILRAGLLAAAELLKSK